MRASTFTTGILIGFQRSSKTETFNKASVKFNEIMTICHDKTFPMQEIETVHKCSLVFPTTTPPKEMSVTSASGRGKIKMADGKAVKKFLTKHPHFELFKDDQNRDKVCKVFKK